jgi:hypothetical protein
MKKAVVMKTHLCVGGPQGGKRQSIEEHHQRFRVAERPKIGMPRGDMVRLKVVEYREQEIGGVMVWAPSDQDVTQTMLLLLNAYEQHNTK